MKFGLIVVFVLLIRLLWLIECPLTWLGNHPALLPNQYALTLVLGQTDLGNCPRRGVLLFSLLLFPFSLKIRKLGGSSTILSYVCM